MKKVTYLIDDSILRPKKEHERFRVYYTLNEDNNKILYKLEDEENKKINIDDLNGYEKQYIDVCFELFRRNSLIPKEYENIIKILDKPRTITPEKNIRYELFREYAKENNIRDNNVEFIFFIDNMIDIYEKIYSESPVSNANKFDNLIKYQVLSKIVKKLEEKDIRNSNKINRLLKKYNVSAETLKTQKILFQNIDDIKNEEDEESL